jgi:hypothetical protein
MSLTAFKSTGLTKKQVTTKRASYNIEYPFVKFRAAKGSRKLLSIIILSGI